MKARGRLLNDPPPSQWEAGLRGPIHAMIMVANTKQANVSFLAKQLEIEIADFADAVQSEFGNQQVNERKEGVEHFGYIDGRGQPLMLQELIDDEYHVASLWNPAAGPSLVLVRDPFGGRAACGSYFVFLKLEQNIKAFKNREVQLAKKLKLKGDARELAGALVAGRFEDGTPVTLFDELMIEGSTPHSAGGSVPNNFDYRDDLDGCKCPFHAHIRKCNPRGTGSGGLKEDNARRMARRGISHGERQDDGKAMAKLPTGGVGLLFMAYQRDITDQFEFIQSKWVNSQIFPTSLLQREPAPIR